jgi:hypothetical protein
VAASALVLLGTGSAASPPPDSQSVSCGAVDGAAALLGDQAKRYIIVGERHGTAQIPAFFAELACLAAAQGPLIVGLEMEADQQQALDTFLRSDGSASARQAWRRQKHWRLRDGRGSAAMWALVERLRQLKAGGRDVTAIAFMHQANTPEARERAMAEAWARALAGRTEARLLVLIGSVHAESEPVGHSIPAASFVPPRERLTLGYVPQEALRCTPLACPAGIAAGRAGILARAPAAWRWPRFDAYYAVGRPFSASGPAPESP